VKISLTLSDIKNADSQKNNNNKIIRPRHSEKSLTVTTHLPSSKTAKDPVLESTIKNENL
jgi:hypothetical protein